MRLLISAIVVLMAFVSLSQKKYEQSSNPFGNPIHQTEEKQQQTIEMSKEDSLEMIADITNNETEWMIRNRKRLNDIEFSEVRIMVTVELTAEVEVNPKGNVVAVKWVETSTNDPQLLAMVATKIREQLRYESLEIDFNTLHFYTVRFVPN